MSEHDDMRSSVSSCDDAVVPSDQPVHPLVSPNRSMLLTIVLAFLTCVLSVPYNFVYDLPAYGGTPFMDLFGIDINTRSLAFTCIQIPAAVIMVLTAPVMIKIGVRGVALLSVPLSLVSAWLPVVAISIARAGQPKLGWGLFLAGRVFVGLVQDPTTVIQARYIAHFFKGRQLPPVTGLFAMGFRAASFIAALVLPPVMSSYQGVLNGAVICGGLGTAANILHIIVLILYCRSKPPSMRQIKNRRRRERRKLVRAHKRELHDLGTAGAADAASARLARAQDEAVADFDHGTELSIAERARQDKLKNRPTFITALKSITSVFCCMAFCKLGGIATNIALSSSVPSFLTLSFGYTTAEASLRQSAISLAGMTTPLIIGAYLSRSGNYVGAMRFGLSCGAAGVVTLLYIAGSYSAANPPPLVLSYIPFILCGCLHGGVFTSFSSSAPLLTSAQSLSIGLSVLGALQAAATAGATQLFGALTQADRDGMASGRDPTAMPTSSFILFWFWAGLMGVVALAIYLDSKKGCVLTAATAANVIARAVKESGDQPETFFHRLFHRHHGDKHSSDEGEADGETNAEREAARRASEDIIELAPARTFSSFRPSSDHSERVIAYTGAGGSGSVCGRDRALSTVSSAISRMARARADTLVTEGRVREARAMSSMAELQQMLAVGAKDDLRTPTEMLYGATTITDRIRAYSTMSAARELRRTAPARSEAGADLEAAAAHPVSVSAGALGLGFALDQPRPRSESTTVRAVKLADMARSGDVVRKSSKSRIEIGGSASWHLEHARRVTRVAHSHAAGNDASEQRVIGIITTDGCFVPLRTPVDTQALVAAGLAPAATPAPATAAPATATRVCDSRGVLWDETEEVYMWPSAAATAAGATAVKTTMLEGSAARRELDEQRRAAPVEAPEPAVVDESSAYTDHETSVSDDDGEAVVVRHHHTQVTHSAHMSQMSPRETQSDASDDYNNGSEMDSEDGNNNGSSDNEAAHPAGPDSDDEDHAAHGPVLILQPAQGRRVRATVTAAAAAARAAGWSRPTVPGAEGRDEMLDCVGHDTADEGAVAGRLLAAGGAGAGDDATITQTVDEYFLSVDVSLNALREGELGAKIQALVEGN